MTKWHRLGGLRTDTHISQLWRQESPRSRCQQTVSGESFLPGWEMAIHSLCVHMEQGQTETERDKESSLVSSKNTNPIILGPHPYDFTLTYLFFKGLISRHSYIGG